MIHCFKREQFLPITLNEAWGFFSCPTNLSIITPKELGLHIKGELQSSCIKENDIIHYTVKPLLNISMRWQTKITEVNEPYSFIDEQKKGPYKLWEHKHIFKEVENGIMMFDEIKYKLPFYPISSMFHWVVKNKLNHIFDYRTKKLNQIYNYGHTN